MKIEELQNVKKGVYHNATWKSEKVVDSVNYTKISNGRIKFAKYKNLKIVIAKQSEKAPMETTNTTSNKQWLIEDVLFFNTKTNNYLVQLCTTGSKTKSKYYANGVEITKSEYESVIKPNANGVVPPVFSVKLENLIDIK